MLCLQSAIHAFRSATSARTHTHMLSRPTDPSDLESGSLAPFSSAQLARMTLRAQLAAAHQIIAHASASPINAAAACTAQPSSTGEGRARARANEDQRVGDLPACPGACSAGDSLCERKESARSQISPLHSRRCLPCPQTTALPLACLSALALGWETRATHLSTSVLTPESARRRTRKMHVRKCGWMDSVDCDLKYCEPCLALYVALARSAPRRTLLASRPLLLLPS